MAVTASAPHIAVEGERAGVGRRAAAALTDLALVVGGYVGLLIVSGLVLLLIRRATGDLTTARTGPAEAVARAIIQLALYGGPFTYLYLMWRSGGSVGMRALHCRLRSVDGVTGPSPRQLLLRLCGLWLSVVFLGVGLLWGLTRRDRRGWSDLMADTAVMHVRPPVIMWWAPQPPPVPDPPRVTWTPSPASVRAPWTWTDVLPVVVLTLPLSFGVEFITVQVLKWLLHGVALGTRRPIEALAADFTAYGATLLLVLLFVKVRRHSTLQALGLRRVQWRWIAATLPFAFAAFILSAITGLLSRGLFPTAPANQCVSIRGSYGGAIWLAIIGVAVIAPLVEEIVFRGMVFGWLRGRVPITWAVLISAALFSLEHIGFLQLTLFLPTFGAGILLAVLYHNARSLWPNVIVHGTFNLIGVLVLFSAPTC